MLTKVRLGDAFTLIGGGTPSTNRTEYWGEGTPWFSSADIDAKGKIAYRRCVTKTGIENSTTNIVPANTVIVVTRVGLGKIAILPEEMCYSQDMQALLAKDTSLVYSRKYLYYQLVYIMETVKYQGQGTTISGITKKRLADVMLYLPGIDEQQRIVARIEELFSQLDAAEATLQKTKAQLALYRQAVYASAYKGLPANHSIVEYFDITGGITKNSARSSMPNKRPYLRVANVYYNRLDLSEIKEIGVTDIEIEKCTLAKNDLLFVEGNGSKSQIGRVAIWDGSIPDIVHQNHIIKGRPNGKMLPEFALFYLISSEGRKQITEVAKSTSGLYTLSTDKVRKLQIPYCDYENQLKLIEMIVARLSICDSLEQTVDIMIKQNKALKMSILKQSFGGNP